MRKRISLLLCFVIFIVCVSGCSYHPPEGWTAQHHTYEEVLAFAKSLDPNATVSEVYTDTTDEYDWQFREWDAVILGIDCHVASVADWVWNDGFLAGEFSRFYYRIDTDYDYVVLQQIVSADYPDWATEQSIRSKYHSNTNSILVKPVSPEYRRLNDGELEQIWQMASEIHEKYKKLSICRNAIFCVPSPCEYYSYSEETYIVRKDGYAYIEAFTEQGKDDFLREYNEDWDLLTSRLPVRE